MKTLNKENQHEININIDSLPEWANYIAMDEDGDWYAYEEEPIKNKNFHFFAALHTNERMRGIYISHKEENWEESLYKIERMENKQEKHKWYNEIIAFAEGKEIEARLTNDSSREWIVAEDPPFNHGLFEFRVKKEDKYIPFTFEDREVFRGKWIRNKYNKKEFFPTRITKEEINHISYEEAFDKWEFLDGTPFGKLEGGSDE